MHILLLKLRIRRRFRIGLFVVLFDVCAINVYVRFLCRLTRIVIIIISIYYIINTYMVHDSFIHACNVPYCCPTLTIIIIIINSTYCKTSRLLVVLCLYCIRQVFPLPSFLFVRSFRSFLRYVRVRVIRKIVKTFGCSLYVNIKC